MLPVKNIRCNAKEKSNNEEESNNEKSSNNKEINIRVKKYKGKGEVTCSYYYTLSIFYRLL